MTLIIVFATPAKFKPKTLQIKMNISKLRIGKFSKFEIAAIIF
jgi:hypothetical protein